MTEKPVDVMPASLQNILNEMKAACARVGRDLSEVSLMAVTKTVPPERVNEVLATGVTLIGENRVQEYLSKKDAYQKPYTFHFIGHLQTNKIKDIISDVDCIESVDSMRLLCAVHEQAKKANRKVACLLEWNAAGEESKTGADKVAIREMLLAAAEMPFIRVEGLMCMPPVGTAEETRPYFKEAFALYTELKATKEGQDFKTLSMGMSHDYAVAIEEGATIVRVGSALFGDRHYQ